MADGGGGASGVLGVLVGAMLVIFVGAGVLMATGKDGRAGRRRRLVADYQVARCPIIQNQNNSEETEIGRWTASFI